jgi:hypothetical protein
MSLQENNTQQIVEELASGVISKETAIERLGSNSRKRQPRVERVPYFKVTKNGAIALNNVRRQPIVFYADQWEKVYSLQEEFQTYTLNEESVKRRS